MSKSTNDNTSMLELSAFERLTSACNHIAMAENILRELFFNSAGGGETEEKAF